MFIMVFKGKKSKNRISRWLRKSKYEVSESSFLGKKYYTVRCAGETIPWKKIMKEFGTQLPFFLEDSDDAVPGIRTVREDGALLERALMNSALAHCKKNRPEKLTIVDYSGRMSSYVEPFIRYSRYVRIVTEQTDAYTSLAFRILCKTGMSLLISKDIRSSYDSAAVVIPEAINETVIYAGKTKVFCMSPDGIIAGDMTVARRFVCPYSVMREIPDGVDKERFLSVVYAITKDEKLTDAELDIA